AGLPLHQRSNILHQTSPRPRPSCFLIDTRSLPLSLAVTLTALPSMSLLPIAPFFLLPSSLVLCYFPRFMESLEKLARVKEKQERTLESQVSTTNYSPPLSDFSSEKVFVTLSPHNELRAD